MSFAAWFSSVMQPRRVPLRSAPRRRKPMVLERLEDRTVPATHTWTGLGADANWSTPANWDNNTSFGTDRHQYLLSTATSLSADLPDLEVDTSFQSVLLKLKRVGIYQYHAPNGPYGSLGEASDLRRELFAFDDGDALFSRADVWLNQRSRLFLPWSGTEELGLTDAWIGQGNRREDNHMSWIWLVQLQDILDGTALVPVGQTVPLDPDAFELPQPALPIKPRSGRQAGSTG